MTAIDPSHSSGLRVAFAWVRSRLLASIEPNDARAQEPFAPPPLLTQLGQSFALSPFEQQLVLLCLSVEHDPRLAEACALAQGQAGRAFPTLALACAVFGETNFRALAADAPLRRYGLVEVEQSEFVELSVARLRLSHRLLQWLSGAPGERRGLSSLVSLLRQPNSAMAIEDGVLDRMRPGFSGELPPILRLVGRDAAAKQVATLQAAAEAGLEVLRLAVEDLPETLYESREIVQILEREERLAPFCLYVAGRSPAEMSPAQAAALLRILEGLESPAVVDVETLADTAARPVLAVTFEPPDHAARCGGWIALAGLEDADAERLASNFETTLSEIAAIGAAVLPTPAESKVQLAWQACQALSRPVLDRLATRVISRTALDDIVLPRPQKAQLEELLDRVRLKPVVTREWGFAERSGRGLGLSALFAGESGTGKTFAAEAVANALGFDLYRIDLSAVVSKFIGETEKNLRRVFDAAERGGVALFFDESDSLFGKRTDVRDSHDRYANIEINYLLQRMEDYGGLSILATNRRGAIDHAFTRRLDFVIEFPFPGRSESEAIWKRAFPSASPTGALDFDRLAELNMSGGSIRNVALGAAYLAARRSTAIETEVVLEAARSELRKLGRSVQDL